MTAHDGFTLNDLVSYNQKHNEANKEDNRDGTNDNLSWNCGVEGPTTDENILNVRERQKRNFLATLLLSQGVPMITAGDEFGRTQGGNNNAYCQDNEISWVNWDMTEKNNELLQFTRFLLRFFHEHPILQRRRFFNGRDTRQTGIKDLTWFHPDGHEMTEADWNNSQIRFLGLRLAGDAIEEMDEHGEPITDDTILILLNGHYEPINFVLPECPAFERWRLIMDTRESKIPQVPIHFDPKSIFKMESRSVALFVLPHTVGKTELQIKVMESTLQKIRKFLFPSKKK